MLALHQFTSYSCFSEDTFLLDSGVYYWIHVTLLPIATLNNALNYQRRANAASISNKAFSRISIPAKYNHSKYRTRATRVSLLSVHTSSLKTSKPYTKIFSIDISCDNIFEADPETIFLTKSYV
ncbi:uncharacterized protein LOC119637839 [Glossina fuscipes]|uniref:Uncharacterized protein LOC119637839 n=1 Tax=Glossina fuscipes TaxID=7396 RepID=A0A9C5Z5Z2_9MUSC|nr:uncharacterized protein LOC119637839 [Glossina fuscipes]